MRNVQVDLENSSYQILIGENLQEPLEDFLKNSSFSRHTLIVTDQTVGALHGDKIMAVFSKAGFVPEVFQIASGESSKSLAAADKIYTKAISIGLDRKSLIVALGGGVVGDLAGFIAATYMRGVPFLQLPTSLLAQVDSSVGGKVAVNHALGKNLIGAFYQPRKVFIDLTLLQTLPQREIYTGLAEIIKYGIIYDEEFFQYLNDHNAAVLQLDHAVMSHVIARSCEIKALVVGQDEKEAGLRMILNFGHTIAHAIESATHYALYNHGEAVAIGMHGAARISYQLGLISQNTLKRVTATIKRFHLPLTARQCTAEQLFELLFHDKKVLNGKIQWILMKDIGKVCIKKDVPIEIVQRVLREVIAQ